MKNDEIILRVRELIKEKGLSDGKFADMIKMDRPALSKRLLGRVMCGEGFVNRIVIELGVNKQWLRDGIGEKYIQRKDKDSTARESESRTVTDLRAENNRLSRALLDKMNEVAELRDALHKHEIEELKSQIMQSEPQHERE